MSLLPPQQSEQLSLFHRQYAQLLNVDLLAFPSTDSLRNSAFQSVLYATLFDETEVHHPPPERYQLRVLKELVARIESSVVDPEEDEVSDDLVSRLATLLASPLPPEFTSAQQKSYVTYMLPPAEESAEEPKSVTVMESRTLISSSGTTGLRTWEAALRLGAYLSSSAGMRLVQGKRVLELGAGTGFLSVLCAKHLGATHVLATDGDEGIVRDLGVNMALNGLEEEKVDTAALWWGRDLVQAGSGTFASAAYDVVLGADVTYDASVVPSLVSTIRDLMELNPYAKVIIAATIRNEQTFEAFISACRANKFSFEDIWFNVLPLEQQRGFFHPTSTPIRILSITRAKAKSSLTPCS
ncbi:MAG: hypothetical protein M1819_002334 [Sarea resinae]|nr:MAG: hypothetical protein M1819_002334 [Sarea resinae]